MRYSRRLLILGAAAAVGAGPLSALLHAEDFSDPSSAAFWGETWFDGNGAFNQSDTSRTSASGGVLSAVIPTDATPVSPLNEVVNDLNTNTSIPGAALAYNGSLLGNLSTKTGITATFSLNNSTLSTSPAAQFQTSQFVGDGTGAEQTAPPDANDPTGYPYNSGDPTPSLRFLFEGTTPDLTDDPSGNTPNAWWSNPGAVVATNMNNGQFVTLSVNFDPSLWSNFDGQVGNVDLAHTADFATALADVKLTGISFGSGFFFSDGFGFQTGGDASLQVDSIETTPEPASLGLLGFGGMALLRRRRK